MDRFRLKTPFCGTGDFRCVTITAGCVYLILALGGATTGFGYNPRKRGYGSYGENYVLMLLGISSVVWIISNILLIHGAVKRRHNFLLTWIYWQLVFVIIDLMVIVWVTIVMTELKDSWTLADEELKYAMIAALCCVVPFLITVIYSSIVVYSFYCDLEGAKSKEDMPDTSVSRRHVEPPGSNTSHRPPPIPPNTVEENISVDVQKQTARYSLHVTPPGSSTSPRRPPIQPKTTEENIVEDVWSQTGSYNLGGMPHGSSTSPRPPPIPPKTTEENIVEDVWSQTGSYNLGGMPHGSNTSPRAVPIPPKRVAENIRENVQMQTGVYNIYVTPPGSNTTSRPPPIPAKRVAENICEDVRMQTGRYNLSGMPPGSSTSPRAPTIPPKTQEDEHIYHELDMHTADHIVRSVAAKAEADELYAVFGHSLPERN